jgi:hypothetical protein
MAVRAGLAAAAVIAAVVLLFEGLYRWQLVDTYRAELAAYNPPEALAATSTQPTLLAMGDSLTAGLHGYPTLLRERLPGWRVINAGLPATGAFQANLIADRRFRRFEPAVFVYQVNVTNDLLNQRFPIDWGELSAARNLYWSLAHRLRSLEYLNYRAAQLALRWRARRSGAGGHAVADVDPTERCAHRDEPFDPAQYTLRERLYLQAEPYLIENQVTLSGGRERDFEIWIGQVVALLRRCAPPRCAPKVLVVPHASQVAPAYLDELGAAGARFHDPTALARGGYRFLEALTEELARRGLAHVEVLDALPRLAEAEAAGVDAYYRYDPHLNACGQRLLADLVAESVRGD